MRAAYKHPVIGILFYMLCAVWLLAFSYLWKCRCTCHVLLARPGDPTALSNVELGMAHCFKQLISSNSTPLISSTAHITSSWVLVSHFNCFRNSSTHPQRCHVWLTMGPWGMTRQGMRRVICLPTVRVQLRKFSCKIVSFCCAPQLLDKLFENLGCFLLFLNIIHMLAVAVFLWVWIKLCRGKPCIGYMCGPAQVQQFSKASAIKA